MEGGETEQKKEGSVKDFLWGEVSSGWETVDSDQPFDDNRAISRQRAARYNAAARDATTCAKSHGAGLPPRPPSAKKDEEEKSSSSPPPEKSRGRSPNRQTKSKKKKSRRKKGLKSRSKSRSKSPKSKGKKKSRGKSRSKSPMPSKARWVPRLGQQQGGDDVKQEEEIANEFYFVFEAALNGIVKRLAAALQCREVAESTTFNINIRYGVKKHTLLHQAAEQGHFLMAHYLLEQNAKHDIRDWRDFTPILLAAKNGHKDVALSLLERGAETEIKNSEGKSMLVLAKWGMVMAIMVDPKKLNMRTTTIDLVTARTKLKKSIKEQVERHRQMEVSFMEREERNASAAVVQRKKKSYRQKSALARSTLMAEYKKMVKMRENMHEALADRDRAFRDERVAHEDAEAARKRLLAKVAAVAVAERKKTLAIRTRAKTKALVSSQVGIVDAMTRIAPREMNAQQFCALALRCVTDGPKNERAAKITFAGGVQAIVGAMKRFPSCVNLQKEGSGALANLCRLNLIARSHVSRDGVQVVLQAMRFQNGDVRTQCAGSRVICAVIGALEEDGLVSLDNDEDGEEDQGQTEDSGGIEDLKRDADLEAAQDQLKSHKKSRFDDRNCAIRIVSFAVPVLIHAQRAHSTSPEFLALAGQALYGFSAHDLCESLRGGVPGLCHGLRSMLESSSDAVPVAKVADAMRFSISALANLGKIRLLRELMVEDGNDAHVLTAKVVNRISHWCTILYGDDGDDSKVDGGECGAFGAKVNEPIEVVRAYECLGWACKLMSQLTECENGAVRGTMVRVSFESFLNTMTLAACQSFEPNLPDTPSHIPEPWKAAASFLGEACKACSLMLFSVSDPATGYGHYCHMDDLRPLLAALRRFPHHNQIAVWTLKILKDVSVTHANLLKIGKLGGAEAIVTAMVNQIDSEKVQCCGLRALYDLLLESKESCTLAINCGAENHLCDILKMYLSNAEIRSLAAAELNIMDKGFVNRLEEDVGKVEDSLRSVKSALKTKSERLEKMSL